MTTTMIRPPIAAAGLAAGDRDRDAAATAQAAEAPAPALTASVFDLVEAGVRVSTSWAEPTRQGAGLRPSTDRIAAALQVRVRRAAARPR